MTTHPNKTPSTEFDTDPCLKELHERLLAIRAMPGKDKAMLFRSLAAKAMAYANELEQPASPRGARVWRRESV